ncbi:transposable element Tcb2 transposase [Trichonephila clavipes]|nr:transposable element Tcb2 transposase [Trichonephila clavipes]
MDPACQQEIVQAGRCSVIVWGVCSWCDNGLLIRLDPTLTGVRIATESLQETSFELRHFHWPPKSSDRNIIECIWDALQRAVQKRSPPPLIPIHLWAALQDSWCQLPPAALLQTLIKSMSRRVVVLLHARGCPT